MTESHSEPDLDKRLRELEAGLEVANRRVSALTKVALLSAAVSAALIIAIFVPAVAPKIAKLQAGHLVVDRVSLIRGTVATDITPGLMRVTNGAIEARVAIAHSAAEVSVQGDTVHRASLRADADSAKLDAVDASAGRHASMELYAASKQGAWLKGKQQTMKGERSRTIDVSTVAGPSLRLLNVEKAGATATSYGFEARTDELRGVPVLKLTDKRGDAWQPSTATQPSSDAQLGDSDSAGKPAVPTGKPTAPTPKPIAPAPAPAPAAKDHGF